MEGDGDSGDSSMDGDSSTATYSTPQLTLVVLIDLVISAVIMTIITLLLWRVSHSHPIPLIDIPMIPAEIFLNLLIYLQCGFFKRKRPKKITDPQEMEAQVGSTGTGERTTKYGINSSCSQRVSREGKGWVKSNKNQKPPNLREALLDHSGKSSWVHINCIQKGSYYV